MARLFLRSSFIWGAMLISKSSASPTYTNKFSVALPIPPELPILATYTPPSGNPVDFYEITITPFTKQLWPDLNATTLVGYNGMYPGPTIRATRGREIVLRLINKGDSTASLHLHGSATVAPFDGWASDTMVVGQFKDYYYPNFQESRTLWYHDHAHMVTASNVQKGQAGLYILDDPAEDYGLPTGKYDIPLVLASKQYNTTGALMPTSGGDTIDVNGQLWPYLDVEPRKYRFRILNGAASRQFQLQLYVGDTITDPVAFQVVASDSGYMTGPVQTTSLTISMGERYEIIVDFANYHNQTLKLRNALAGLDSETLGQAMQFRVGSNVTDDANNENVPSSLRNITFLERPITSSKNFTFAFTDSKWTINGETFSDVNNRVLHYVPRGTTEIWTLINGGPVVHPVHVHLVDMQIISRTKNGIAQPIQPYEAAGLKDIIFLGNSETIEVLAKYTPWDGLYMFHCHNLFHEDREMMAVFNVTALEGFNYTEKTRFIQPMDSRWPPKEYNGTNLTEVQDVTLPDFKSLEAYDDMDGLMDALDAFHAPSNSSRR
ncbi:Cupredoxin [Terfezia boudieri ATCC MYA-4762]|uniref:Cupredoxin n=1 Tax=Terfezia boudieri ATCC MYA-4762 TaxID=1051890 RepID=A0A3N4LP09_9PEZI|nr:Cupredoxin [Terfezia boudieri ATCC MYA-4762]